MPFRSALRRVLLGCAWLGATAGSPPGLADGPQVHRPAPPLILHALDGQTFSVSELRGKVVILTFWASWCQPCKEELPLLSDYAAAHAGQGLQVLGFSLDDPAQLALVRRIAAGLDFPVGLLGGNYAGDYGRIWRLPVNFTIDRSGMLVDNSWNDARPDWTAESLERVVTPLLKAVP